MKRGLGWLPDLPDFRDYTSETVVTTKRTATVVELAVRDNRNLCSPIEDQESIGSCTAHAGVGCYEYMMIKIYGKHVDLSRLALYKMTRNLMRVTGDTGAYLRSTMGAMAVCGIPPEIYWPYDITKFDKEPTPFVYSFAKEFQALKYFRLDPLGREPEKTLSEVKRFIGMGYPIMFGFTVYSSIEQADKNGRIPIPLKTDRVDGGHAVMAVGYDNGIEIGSGTRRSVGALLIRNSWGAGWGEAGYGWLPYQYILTGLADDFWSITKQEWVDLEVFDE